MLDTLRRTILAGTGIVALSKEKLEQAIDGLVTCGDLTMEQGRKVRDALLSRAERESGQILERIQTELEKILGMGPLATKAELRGLEGRVAELERRASSLAENPGRAENRPPDAGL